eukprot:scaffold85652_cov17-Tisochrysis_lutea.AAC.1
MGTEGAHGGSGNGLLELAVSDIRGVPKQQPVFAGAVCFKHQVSLAEFIATACSELPRAEGRTRAAA